MDNTKSAISKTHQQGIVLLEALIAILIFSIGILGAVGLQATMIKGTAESKYRAEAGNIVQQRLATLWVNQPVGAVPPNPDTLAAFVEPVPGTDISALGLPNGRRLTIRSNPLDARCAADLNCFTVTVSWQQPGGDQHNVTAVARITQ
jgi:type IV pilus assembly protein PilV